MGLVQVMGLMGRNTRQLRSNALAPYSMLLTFWVVLASGFSSVSCSSTSRNTLLEKDGSTGATLTATGSGGSAGDSTGSGSTGATLTATAGGAGEGGGTESCNAGERSCDGLTPWICSETGSWGVARAACALGCRGGECAECSDGARQCSDGAAKICRGGFWETDELCPVTCEDGTCVDACTEGRLQCDGQVRLQRCDGSTYVDDEECEFVCVGKACVGECARDARRCNPEATNEAQSCNSVGEWGESQPCSDGSFCVAGACKPCEPGSERCTETGPQSCSADGEWVPLGACGTDLPACHEGTCVLCSPGDKRCTNTDLEVCSADGSTWEFLETCNGATPACLESTKACGNCSEGEQQCSSDVVQICDEAGAWEQASTCTGSSPECVAGTCASCDPAAHQRRCQDSDTAQACASDGSWGATTNCSGDTPLCRAELNFSCGCEEGLRRCTENQPEVCTGGAWVPQISCSAGTPYCLPETGRCVACEPDDEQCQSGVAHSCSSDGSWTSLHACSGTEVNCGGCDLGEECDGPDDCSSGFCVSNECAECSPASESCTGTTPRICTTGGSWDNQDPCAAPANGSAMCSGGNCGFTCNSGFKPCENRCIPNSACCTNSECPTDGACVNDACVCDSGFTGPHCVPIFEPIDRISTQDGACEARGISGDGSVIAGFCADASGSSVAFRWVSGSVASLTDEGAGSEAYAVSTDGTIVVGMASYLPAKWVDGSLSKPLPLDPDPYPYTTGYVSDVSADGSRLVGYSHGPYYPWYWVYWGSSASSTPTPFWHLKARQYLEAMADNGDLLVGYILETGFDGYSYFRAAYFQISTGGTNTLPQTAIDEENYAYGVSSNGAVIVGESHLRGEPTLQRQAVVWRGLTMSPELLGVEGRADEANGNGSVIAGTGSISGSSNAAFLWKDGNTVGLQSALTAAGAAVEGWTITAITGLSTDGATLTGYGTNPSGAVQGWRATLTGTDILGF